MKLVIATAVFACLLASTRAFAEDRPLTGARTASTTTVAAVRTSTLAGEATVAPGALAEQPDALAPGAVAIAPPTQAAPRASVGPPRRGQAPELTARPAPALPSPPTPPPKPSTRGPPEIVEEFRVVRRNGRVVGVFFHRTVTGTISVQDLQGEIDLFLRQPDTP